MVSIRSAYGGDAVRIRSAYGEHTVMRVQVQDNGPLIRFFDNKTCYSVHGETAIFIAREFYKTTAVVKYLCGPPATGLPSENVCTLGRSLVT